jgi:hypothetical protein
MKCAWLALFAVVLWPPLAGCAAYAGAVAAGVALNVVSNSSLPANCKPQPVTIVPGLKQATAPYWTKDTASTWAPDRVYYATFTADDVANSKALGDFMESRRAFVQQELKVRNICAGSVKLYGPTAVHISDGACGIEHALVECETHR